MTRLRSAVGHLLSAALERDGVRLHRHWSPKRIGERIDVATGAERTMIGLDRPCWGVDLTAEHELGRSPLHVSSFDTLNEISKAKRIKLIPHGPHLLEAVAEGAGNDGMDGKWTADIDPVDMARKALAKARGEQS